MPTSDAKNFAGKFLEKLGKISREEIESFLSRLQSEKNFFQSVLDHLLEGVVVTDPNGRVLFINRAARGLLGLGSRRKVVGDPLLDHIFPGEMYQTFWAYDPSRDKTFSKTVSAETPEERIFNVTLIPVEDEAGQLVSIASILSDQTESRREEERRIQSERLASLSTLTAGVAHEIKNPLNSLNLHAHLLKKAMGKGRAPTEKNADKASRSAEIIIEEIDRLSRVVEDFLQAARPSQPNFDVKNVNDALRQIGTLIEAEAQERNIEVTLNLDPEILPSRIDELQLGLAFRNILKNSIEAIKNKPGKIMVLSRQTEKAIIIEFHDNGCGISKERIRKIFEPYVTSKFSGTGLGLMVVYRIVTEHGGYMNVQSNTGLGTIFRICLPPGPKPTRLLPDKTGKWMALAAPEEKDRVE